MAFMDAAELLLSALLALACAAADTSAFILMTIEHSGSDRDWKIVRNKAVRVKTGRLKVKHRFLFR
jgi:hypothetical protein